MADLVFFDLKAGKEKKKLPASDLIFKQPLRKDLLNDYVVMQRRAGRQGTHSTKTRAEVSGTGKKPFKQKGTGHARQGTLKGPHQYGGGVCFGPKPRAYTSRLPKKVKLKAIQVALSQKRYEGRLFIIDSLELSSGKTKDAIKALSALKSKSVLIVGNLPEITLRAVRNIETVKVIKPAFLNVMDILRYQTCLLTEESLAWIEENLVQVKKTQSGEEKAA